jgi:hypothetical protein
MSEQETQAIGPHEDDAATQYPPPQGEPVTTPPAAPEQPPPAAPEQPPPAAPPPPEAAAPPPPPPPRPEPQPAAAPPPTYAAPAPLRQPSLVDRAKQGDSEALGTMFSQFLPRGEQMLEGHYLGVLGLWGIGTHSFGAVTPRRFATLRISLLGGVQYNDGSLEYVNSAAVHQPSKVMLYVTAGAVSLFFFLAGLGSGGLPGALIALLISLALLPLTIRLYYRFNKSGIVLWVREGLQVYAFIDRSRMRLANQLYRRCTDAREERLRQLGHP